MEMTKFFNETALAGYIVAKLKGKNELTRIQELKCKLGIEVFLVNLGKALAVYGVAFIFQVVPLTFIFHSAYVVIRMNARGIHAQKSSTCTWISICLFVFLPLVVNNLEVSKNFVLLAAIGVYVCLYRYAPQDTPKNRIADENLRKKLRNKALIGYSFCVILMFYTQSQVMLNQVFFGSLLAVICILPLTYRIVKRIREEE